MTLVLGIETTCDETACALVRNGSEILANVVSSQIDLHNEYGGVVPELACRRHVDLLLPTLDKALQEAKVALEEIDLIAVAHTPGLIGALLIGLNAAKTLSIALRKPFVGVNHVEAHLYAALMSQPAFPVFPCLGVVLSGGHTCLIKMNGIGNYTLLGQTIDDAIGESFDKTAKILGLPYPGGPHIEKLAKMGNPSAYPFKPGRVKGRALDFSFSGLKTQALYAVKGQNEREEQRVLSAQQKNDLCASFQETAFRDVVEKALLAAKQENCHTLVLGGGVTHNQYLRALFQQTAPEFHLVWPKNELSLDNAAMIAGLGYHVYLQKGAGDTLDLEAKTRTPFYSR
ncbi:tRNA (adenosine(37)-N6)-threonylcarbamoyltransferase complex transferase subunit TsaD [Parachlamydia sp. AcF125]|uniref:tRNA (adenosine(37)-N6)-threonylcarbamoyltransferase complex transferase subunit TsaD n=1 Tax=Parachlamydia sp. AcF125 TaxID=2795736 RepID=UPI001BC8F0AF|nr:tRNA (adenosine(37)-N6)-threonylcarbamoyltransferase complex transferase subunit TsaD [Parachlamydia sp. AcF125]MBS4168743.1 tRNA N6-adenosine threonylcarbamoyltransferase [Parachlamydia sp. AcF125]